MSLTVKYQCAQITNIESGPNSAKFDILENVRGYT